ncbi:helix-turn-helix domain-containing protein [Paraburkholderia sp. Tr-20389]|uniref:helix-turn-helix domain-containing protein n=1 Tax=Paraburkholderia sp. Tr-20389 TaxID=2703903 RepID=UPI00197E5CB3|nr:helix-turn-helix domain-containing protein [Paraburkholderia sp. Tr-20389]MBN3754494.1 helix-turn-helix domain-containing protein [Paraburkholderia sp. Tr-20389]
MNPNDSAHDKHCDDDDDDNELDPTVEQLLQLLWEAASESPEKPWSLAKISKRTDLPMSTLRRYLTQLQSAGVIAVQMDEEGRGTATLTDEGRELCEALFGEP